MGQFTIFQDHRSPLHVQCGRVLLVALIPGVIAVVSEHWLAAPSTPTPAPTLTSTPGAPTPTSSPEESMWRYVRHMGLWAACNSHYRCASLPSDHFPDAYGPVRSMLVTALCLHALCIGVGALCSCEDPDNLLGASRHMPRMEETLALLAGILIAGSLGLFAQISQQHPVYRTFHFDWSFWLMLTYLFLLLLAGGVILLLRNKCACRKRCTCHCEQTIFCMETCKRKSFRRNGQSLPTQQENSVKETQVSFFVEEDDCDGKTNVGSVKVCQNGFSNYLERIKGLGFIYSSLEGLPRVLAKSRSEKTEVTDDIV